MPTAEICPGTAREAAIKGECMRVVAAFSYLRPLVYEAASSARIAAQRPFPLCEYGDEHRGPPEHDPDALDSLMSELAASLDARAARAGAGLEGAIGTARTIGREGLRQGPGTAEGRRRTRSALGELERLTAGNSPVRARESAMLAALQHHLARHAPAGGRVPAQSGPTPAGRGHCLVVCREAIRLHMAYTSRLVGVLEAALDALGADRAPRG